MSEAFDPTRRTAYPHLVEDRIRYGDTDRQGHVNNAVYATFFETGRTLLFARELPGLVGADAEPVLVRLVIDYRREMHWPGDVTIGTGVLAVGTSSCRFAQAVFQGESCTASGEAVIVQLDRATRRPKPWSNEQRALLAGLRVG
jgi:acyl-CoA thioester hydrolase